MGAGNQASGGISGFIKERKAWILAPFVLLALGLGVLYVLGEGSQLNPFAYNLF